MTAWLVFLLALLAAPVVPAAGPEHPGRDRRRPDIDVVVPLDPGGPPEVWWQHRKDRRLIPPTVSIGGSPYVCDLDALAFPTRDAFFVHLRSEHLVAPERIPDLLYETEGEVHFAGE